MKDEEIIKLEQEKGLKYKPPYKLNLLDFVPAAGLINYNKRWNKIPSALVKDWDDEFAKRYFLLASCNIIEVGLGVLGLAKLLVK